MIDRLNDMLPHLEQLPAETQEEVLAYLEVLIEALERDAVARGRMRQTLRAIPSTEPWQDPVGAWSDLPDTMLEDLDQLRHATSPTPPIEEL
jgi:hypothetical protein